MGKGRGEKNRDLDEIVGEDLGVCGGHVRGIRRLDKKTRRDVRRGLHVCKRQHRCVGKAGCVGRREGGSFCVGYMHGKSVWLWAKGRGFRVPWWPLSRCCSPFIYLDLRSLPP